MVVRYYKYSRDTTDVHGLCAQHYLTVLSSLVVFPLVVSSVLCVGQDWVAMSEIMGTILFVTGIATLLQCLVGCRYVLLCHVVLCTTTTGVHSCPL